MDILLSFLLTLLIIFFVPILIYGIFSKYPALEEPKEKAQFFLSILTQKVGTAIGFVWLYSYLHSPEWLMYAVIWFVMFAIVEIGQAIVPGNSKKEALAGIVSEAIYFPVAAYAISLIMA